MGNSYQNKVIDIQKTEDSPRILLDENKSIFLIEGSSFPEDAYAVYIVVLDWLKDITKRFENELQCVFKFKVISSASHKMIYEILVELEKLYNKSSNIIIHWYYEEHDEDMLEVGEDFTETLDIPFEFFKF